MFPLTVSGRFNNSHGPKIYLTDGAAYQSDQWPFDNTLLVSVHPEISKGKFKTTNGIKPFIFDEMGSGRPTTEIP
jgi:hypothetical protein